MNKFYQIIVFLSIAIICDSCAMVYTSQDAKEITRNHRIIAILPPKVTIAPHRNISTEALIEQQILESKNFQNDMYAWMLKRKSQNKFNVEIQDLETTNAMLQEIGYQESIWTKAKYCEALGVDAVLYSNYELTKPLSEGAAIAIAIISGFWTTTNEVQVSCSLTDCSNKKVFWNYDHTFYGSVGSSTSRLVDGLMRNASKKMPYCEKIKSKK